MEDENCCEERLWQRQNTKSGEARAWNAVCGLGDSRGFGQNFPLQLQENKHPAIFQVKIRQKPGAQWSHEGLRSQKPNLPYPFSSVAELPFEKAFMNERTQNRRRSAQTLAHPAPKWGAGV
jgi:hypothetical protein